MNTIITRLVVGAVASTFLFASPSFAFPDDGPLRATPERAAANHWTARYTPSQLKKAAQSLDADYLKETKDRNRWHQEKIGVYVDFTPVQNLKWFDQKFAFDKVVECEAKWNEAVDDKFQFFRAESKSKADIVIKFDTYRYNEPEHVGGVTWPKTYGDGKIFKSDIAVFVWSAKHDPYCKDQVAKIVYHEFGHALGLIHSANESDVMHPTNHVSTLSPRDRNSLRKLYGLPDVAPEPEEQRDSISRICDRFETAVQ